MKRVLPALAAAALVSLLGARPFDHEVIPVGTQVNVHLTQPLSSGTAVAGDHFQVMVMEPVVVGHHVVIEKDATGFGRVVTVSKATGKSPGQMTIEISHVLAVDGTIIHVHTYSQHAKQYEYGKAHTATVVGTLLVGPLGLFSHNMVKGKDITITPEQVLPAYTAMNATVHVH